MYVVIPLRRFEYFFLMIGAVFSTPKASLAQMFVGYDTFCELPVVVELTFQLALAATDSMGRQVIGLDPSVFSNQSASRIFVIAHEWAHHRTGHTSGLRP